jgi:hypothetical protein
MDWPLIVERNRALLITLCLAESAVRRLYGNGARQGVYGEELDAQLTKGREVVVRDGGRTAMRALFWIRGAAGRPKKTIIGHCVCRIASMESNFMRCTALFTFIFTFAAASANADGVNDALTKNLYAGTLEQGAETLKALGSAPEARAAQGILLFVSAIEQLGQSLHRHGLETTRGGAMMQFPILRMPVEPNPDPEPLDYQKYRAILQGLFDNLVKADAALEAGAQGDVKLAIDLLKVRADINGDGKASDNESLGFILQALSRTADPQSPPDLSFSFDKADVLWLRGYVQFITAAAQFGLSVDFEETFNKTAHAYFPRAGLPMQEELVRPAQSMGFVDNNFGDALALIHLLNWQVKDPERLKDVRLRLLKLAQLSRDSWQAARAETDNDNEWLPNAKQTSKLAPAPVDDAVIDGWLLVMDEFQAVLDGRKLMPHWRFEKGFNVKRFFEESKRIDAVLITAGVDAIPFLESGEISKSADWDNLTRVFGGNFLGYALWFN